MEIGQVMAELEALGTEKLRVQNARNGAGENQFGVKLGDVRALANRIKTNPGLAAELWETGNLEARFLAILLWKPKDIQAPELERMLRSIEVSWLADWFNSYLVKPRADKEEVRERWMDDENPAVARAGWSLTTERIEKSPEGLDLGGLLDRIEREMGTAHPLPQWTMNFALIAIGVHHPAHRDRAMQIGERLGVLRDYPTSKGCISPFAPIAIAALAARQG